jgi:hypothetical protein
VTSHRKLIPYSRVVDMAMLTTRSLCGRRLHRDLAVYHDHFRSLSRYVPADRESGGFRRILQELLALQAFARAHKERCEACRRRGGR